ncbi:hypothetical protein K470DRAFT_257006 [Piedraia hortae CBS 480.64]|uniref:Uncharacterized protein n=1 Tax=Piedraia hortae CBS 480.64 TaxID=1314780 RepID=A0A6A7C1E6_9PEZI|nr:hypothetical protein K470DRAFT_257006 [Piedraia hortae CBS 480.64]
MDENSVQTIGGNNYLPIIPITREWHPQISTKGRDHMPRAEFYIVIAISPLCRTCGAPACLRGLQYRLPQRYMLIQVGRSLGRVDGPLASRVGGSPSRVDNSTSRVGNTSTTRPYRIVNTTNPSPRGVNKLSISIYDRVDQFLRASGRVDNPSLRTDNPPTQGNALCLKPNTLSLKPTIHSFEFKPTAPSIKQKNQPSPTHPSKPLTTSTLTTSPS